MHIPDGMLPLPVAIAGMGLSVAVAGLCLRKINQRPDPREDIPKAALLTAAFFVASLIHIPIPPASAHLMLNGLLGALLGFYAFPAILIGLFFQAVMFGHGGFITLGINGVIIGVPAMLAHQLFRLRHWGNLPGPRKTMVFGFLAGFITVLLSVGLFAGIVLGNISADLSVAAERTAILALVAAHIPLAVLEGLATGLLAAFFQRVKPNLLDGL